jgi:Flp pilus assembly protein TadG
MSITKGKSRAAIRSSNIGSVAIEFGIAAPMLMILFVAVVEVGFAVYQAMQVQTAIEAGALDAAENGGSTDGISTAVLSATGLAGITATPSPAQFCGCPGTTGVVAVLCSATCVGGNTPGQYVRISAALTRKSLIPNSGLLLPATFTAQSIIRLH